MISPIKKYYDLLTDCKAHALNQHGRDTKPGKAASEAWFQLSALKREREKMRRPEEAVINAQAEYDKACNEHPESHVWDTRAYAKEALKLAKYRLENHSGIVDKLERDIHETTECYVTAWTILVRETNKAKAKTVKFLRGHGLAVSDTDKPMDIMNLAKKEGFIVRSERGDWQYPTKANEKIETLKPFRVDSEGYWFKGADIAEAFKHVTYVSFQGLNGICEIYKGHYREIAKSLGAAPDVCYRDNARTFEHESEYRNSNNTTQVKSEVVLAYGTFRAVWFDTGAGSKDTRIIAMAEAPVIVPVKSKLSPLGKRALEAILAA